MIKDWINESVKNRFLIARNEISFEVFAFEVSGGWGFSQLAEGLPSPSPPWEERRREREGQVRQR